ncbi:hypothetical protein FAIPA1_170102 [Frankia sp. AiPs1]
MTNFRLGIRHLQVSRSDGPPGRPGTERSSTLFSTPRAVIPAALWPGASAQERSGSSYLDRLGGYKICWIASVSAPGRLSRDIPSKGTRRWFAIRLQGAARNLPEPYPPSLARRFPRPPAG